jgi:hypothetical protein
MSRDVRLRRTRTAANATPHATPCAISLPQPTTIESRSSTGSAFAALNHSTQMLCAGERLIACQRHPPAKYSATNFTLDRESSATAYHSLSYPESW